MRHFYSLQDVDLSHSWVTIGTFDGVHLGHQKIIRGLVENAHSADQPAVVVTFHPHPKLVLGGEQRPFYLTLPETRAELLHDMGVDVVITHPFNDQVSQLSAQDFVSRLDAHLGIKKLWVGYDFALGKDREGDAERLRQLGKDYGFTLRQVAPHHIKDEVVSSSSIRSLLREGEAQRAARLLGRLFQLRGEVVGGDKRGKDLGFPTANLDIPREMIQIKSGIYATYTIVEGQRLPSVTNVGFRPTFDDALDFPVVETYILDFSGDLYGEELRLEFHTFLRDELKFDTVPALIEQMHQDVEHTRQVLDV